MKFSVVSVSLGLAATMQLVAAQNLSPCATACVGQAATADGCTGITDINCVCTNAQFQQDALSCLTDECTPDDLSALVALQTAVCDGAGLSATGSATNTAPFSASDVSSGTGTSLSIPTSGAASSSASGSASGSASSSTSVSSSGSAATSGATTVSTPASVSIPVSSPAGSSTPATGATTTASSPAGTTSSSAAQNLQIPSFGLGLMALFMLL
ncbi:hypothetical protein D9757_009436 [Collybiopsis confluens]|uniref:CFEM domain-containing protein n=1 Tax=Collybiopsis confluens TaxID=2823264 RepID=A0A8H5M562_9AGAR|nr:hypothetical protein D9757_009436 [Collybiopsis confluens]